MIRIVLQKDVRATRERWLFHGLVRIITHPRPHWKVCPPEIEAAMAPFRTHETGGEPAAATAPAAATQAAAATKKKDPIRRDWLRALRRARSTTGRVGSGGSLPASPPTPPAARAL
jgi:hypothetical protein